MGRPMAAASEPTDTNLVMATATINMPSSDRPMGQYQARITPRPTAIPLAAVEVKVGREDVSPHGSQANDAEHPVAGGTGNHDTHGEAIAHARDERTGDKDAGGAL